MSAYRDDLDALRQRATELEEELGDARRRLAQRERSVEERIRFYTEGEAFNVVVSGVVLLLGAALALILRQPITVLAFVPPALVLAHRRGIDVLPREREIVSWHWLGVRFGRARLAAARMTIAKLSVRGGWEPRANLLMNGYVLGKNLPHARARAIAEEVSRLCECPPPKSIG